MKLLPSIIDVSLKRFKKPAWGSCRPKGMLAADAITDGFGWGLLYIPESMRRDLSRTFDTHRALAEDKSAPDREGLFQRWARLTASHKAGEEPSASETVGEREKLRYAGLRHLAVKQATERSDDGSKKSAVSEKSRHSGDGLWDSLRRRFGVGAATSTDETPARVALLHNVELGQKLAKAAVDQRQVKAESSGRGKFSDLHQNWLRGWLQRRTEAGGEISVETGKDRVNNGLLHNPQWWQARIKKELSSKSSVEPNGRLQPEVRMEGLLYREGAWGVFKSRWDGKNVDGRVGMVKSSSHRDGLLRDERAWGRYLGKVGKSSATYREIENTWQAGGWVSSRPGHTAPCTKPK